MNFEKNKPFIAIALGAFAGLFFNFGLALFHMHELLRTFLGLSLGTLFGLECWDSIREHKTFKDWLSAQWPKPTKTVALLSSTSSVPDDMLESKVFGAFAPTHVLCAFDWPKVKELCEKRGVTYQVCIGDSFYKGSSVLVYFTSAENGTPKDLFEQTERMGVRRMCVFFV